MNEFETPDTETPREQAAPGRLSVAALRRAVPRKMWAGPGCGDPCALCRVAISPEDIDYEVDAELDAQPLTLHFHVRCHESWNASRVQELPEGTSTPSASAA